MCYTMPCFIIVYSYFYISEVDEERTRTPEVQAVQRRESTGTSRHGSCGQQTERSERLALN